MLFQLKTLTSLSRALSLAAVLGILSGCNPTVPDTSGDTGNEPADEATATTEGDSGDSAADNTQGEETQSEDSASVPRDDENAIVIDVRSAAEWDTGHVASAVNIPHTEIADRISEVTEDKDANIVLYCKSGGRAGMAKKALEELGFSTVENAGGYSDVKDRFPAE